MRRLVPVRSLVSLTAGVLPALFLLASDQASAQIPEDEQKCIVELNNLSMAFPGIGLTDPNGLVNALDRTVECLACLALNGADALDRECDEVDDGDPNNNSCPLF